MFNFSSRTIKKICISFDWHNDRDYRNMLTAWTRNSRNPVSFVDLTPNAINSNDISRVKGVLTHHIREATHTLVLVGEHANDLHRDRAEIGARNWIWWEIAQSKDAGNKLIVVKIKRNYRTPDPLLNVNASWAMSYTQEAILHAIDAA